MPCSRRSTFLSALLLLLLLGLCSCEGGQHSTRAVCWHSPWVALRMAFLIATCGFSLIPSPPQLRVLTDDRRRLAAQLDALQQQQHHAARASTSATASPPGAAAASSTSAATLGVMNALRHELDETRERLRNTADENRRLHEQVDRLDPAFFEGIADLRQNCLHGVRECSRVNHDLLWLACLFAPVLPLYVDKHAVASIGVLQRALAQLANECGVPTPTVKLPLGESHSIGGHGMLSGTSGEEPSFSDVSGSFDASARADHNTGDGGGVPQASRVRFAVSPSTSSNGAGTLSSAALRINGSGPSSGGSRSGNSGIGSGGQLGVVGGAMPRSKRR